MINITIDKNLKCILIENDVIYQSDTYKKLENVADVIRKVLNKAYYGGEKICVQTRMVNGDYLPINMSDEWPTKKL